MPDGTPGLLCQSSPGLRQTAIFLYKESTDGGINIEVENED
jgi:hypothetical protein